MDAGEVQRTDDVVERAEIGVVAVRPDVGDVLAGYIVQVQLANHGEFSRGASAVAGRGRCADGDQAQARDEYSRE